MPEYFDLIACGKKKYECRVADFEVAEGDILVLEEWDSLDHAVRKPTGRVLEKKVTYPVKFDLDTFTQLEDMQKTWFLYPTVRIRYTVH